MNIETEIANLHVRYSSTERKVDEALEAITKSRFTSVCTAATVLFCLWLGWFVRGLA